MHTRLHLDIICVIPSATANCAIAYIIIWCNSTRYTSHCIWRRELKNDLFISGIIQFRTEKQTHGFWCTAGNLPSGNEILYIHYIQNSIPSSRTWHFWQVRLGLRDVLLFFQLVLKLILNNRGFTVIEYFCGSKFSAGELACLENTL